MLIPVLEHLYDFEGKPTHKHDRRFSSADFVYDLPRGMRYYFECDVQTLSDVVALQRFYQTCDYADDLEVYGQPEYWAAPDEFEHHQRGDCEDFAIYGWRQLHDMAHSVRIVCGLLDGEAPGGHMWLHAHLDGQNYIIEPTHASQRTPHAHHKKLPRASARLYHPMMSVAFDGKRFQYYKHERVPWSPKTWTATLLWLDEAWYTWRVLLGK